VALRQPLAQARRQQQLLLAITRDELPRHPGMVLIAPDGTPLYATASMRSGRLRLRSCSSSLWGWGSPRTLGDENVG
jgi:hypothetical protein